jgi:hypothetical protein
MDSALPRLAIVVLVTSLLLAPRATLAHADAQPTQYVVLSILPDGSVQPLFSTAVVMHRSTAAPPTALLQPARGETEIALQLHDASGALVFEDTLRLPTWLRSETPGAPLGDGTFAIESHRIPVAARTFVARVPIVPGARLSLQSGLVSRATELHLDALPTVAPAAAPDVVRLVQNGDPANRLDMLIMGDGYTAAERAKFESDAADITAGFFSITPLREYRNYANVTTLFVPSSQSGADQPAFDADCTQFDRVQTCCGDSTAFGAVAVTVDTAFDATFCSFNVQRALTVDDVKVFATAAAFPDWDMIVVLVNSPVYGGTGGPLSAVSISGFQAAVTQHEHGHTFGRLADEYDDAFPGYPPCSDVTLGFPRCEPNVTDQTSRTLIKWQRWIAAAQPIPSIDPPPVETAAGLWEGARYLSTDKYRPGFACIMRVNGAPFCDVASEAIALRYYQGGWGTPTDGIDNIEPGTENPPAGSVVVPESGGTFSAALLGPEAGPALATEWFVDGLPMASAAVANGARASYALAAAPGLHTLELHVTDRSPIIHDTVRADVMSRRAWAVNVGAAGSSICGDADGSGTVTVTDGVQALRAAASLPSLCFPSRCDVDGSGTVSVTDGVNVLRAAASLPFSAACPAD